MTDAASFGFMQARIQARHGDRLTPEQWRQLDACRDLGRYLQLARASDLGKWTRHFAAGEDPAQWERSLRADWNDNLLAVTEWLPQRWHAAMRWLQSLPWLPAIGHALNGEVAPAWLSEDPFFADFDLTNGETFRESLAASDWSGIVEHWDSGRPVESWLDSWRATWPLHEHKTARELELACTQLAGSWSEAAASHADWHASLEQKFTRLLRRQPRTILSMVGYIGLVSLDMMHLRAGLMRLHIAQRPAENGR